MYMLNRRNPWKINCCGLRMSIFKFRSHGAWVEGEWKKAYQWLLGSTYVSMAFYDIYNIYTCIYYCGFK